MNGQENRLPLLGEKAPSFVAHSTQGPIRFPEDYTDKWVVFFSHPADFTPVCTTEFLAFAARADEFKKRNAELLGLSIDSTFSHIAWLRTIKDKVVYKGMKDIEITFPVISDVTMEISREFGMVQPSASTTQAVRAVFIIDPKATVRAILYYPLTNGRNVEEILRLLIAIQHSDKYEIATPANWQPGEDVIVPPPGSCGAAAERLAKAGNGYQCLDWFLCLKEDPGP